MKYVICMVDLETGEFYEVDKASTLNSAKQALRQFKRSLPYTEFVIKHNLSLGIYKEGDY